PVGAGSPSHSRGVRGQRSRPPVSPPGSVILELSKEKAAERLLERQAAAFGAAVAKVEAELGAQIRYLTQVATGQPHEGSSYAARKGCQLALNRMEYARRRL
ncbi:mediator of RNA polymerase II transcription subunit 11, partial [Meleagris gallopavo]|uniref:mediator of RNA polymerase II transcription subunit 11 n=1 Tax=Meleagris gallopavo TaxID=9103 RepID=UPI00093C5CD5